MAGINKIFHKGKEILFIDYVGVKNVEEMIVILKEAQSIIIKDNKEYLQLTDMTGAFATPVFMSKVKAVAKETPRIAKKRAIVGVDSPARKILLHGYNLIIGKNAVKPFDTIEAAKDWLVA